MTAGALVYGARRSPFSAACGGKVRLFARWADASDVGGEKDANSPKIDYVGCVHQSVVLGERTRTEST